jgi:hypothetical protein
MKQVTMTVPRRLTAVAGSLEPSHDDQAHPVTVAAQPGYRRVCNCLFTRALDTISTKADSVSNECLPAFYRSAALPKNFRQKSKP